MKMTTKKREKRRKNEERSRNKLNREITQDEVSKAIDLLKNHKAAGQDGVIGEILKVGGEKIRKAVWLVCSVAWKTERVPIDWMQGWCSRCTKTEITETR